MTEVVFRKLAGPALLSLLCVCGAQAKSRAGRLAELLESARGAERVRIIAALGRTDSADALEPLLKQFQFRKAAPAVSVAVVRALGRLKRKEAVGPLAEAWDYHESVKLRGELPAQLQQLRAAIIEALGLIGDKKGAAIVLAAVADPDQGVSLKAVEACGRLKDRKAVGLLLELAEREPGSSQAVFEALSEIGDSRAKPVLERALKSDAPAVQAAAAYAVAKMEGKSGKEALKQVLTGHPAGRESLMPAYYLARLDESAGFDHLLAVVLDRDSPLRETAAEYLAKAGGRKAVPPLAEALEDSKDPFLRLLCVRVLAGVGGPKAVHSLYRAAQDKDAQVASAARAALTDLGEYDD